MEFYDKKSRKILYLLSTQDEGMWEIGFLTLVEIFDNGDRIRTYKKMEEIVPISH